MSVKMHYRAFGGPQKQEDGWKSTLHFIFKKTKRDLRNRLVLKFLNNQDDKY